MAIPLAPVVSYGSDDVTTVTTGIESIQLLLII